MAYQVCTKCDVRRQLPWHLRLDPDHAAGVYVCKYCKPPKGKTWSVDPEYRRDHILRVRYGLSAGEYDAMLATQGGVCAICKRPPKQRRLYVDHDHATQIVRGILCAHCNSALAWLEEWEAQARSYLDPAAA